MVLCQRFVTWQSLLLNFVLIEMLAYSLIPSEQWVGHESTIQRESPSEIISLPADKYHRVLT